MNRDKRILEFRNSEFTTREDGENHTIEGYFAVFNSIYQMDSMLSESIAPGAFTNSLSNDVRALINHDTTLVLGRTGAHTFTISQDERGLYGVITINPKDSDAMNAYERVKRGDVSGCSIGFNIIREATDVSEDGSIHWTIEDVELFECSVCTFPAYEQTNITARAAEREEIMKRRLEAKREKVKARFNHGIETVEAAQAP